MKKSILLTITFLLIASVTFGQSGKLKRANRHFEKGNYEKAFWLYYKVLDIEDNNEAKIKGAYACLKMKNYREAEYWLYQTLQIENTPNEYFLFLAACYMENTYDKVEGTCLVVGNPIKYKFAKSWLQKYKLLNPNDKRIEYLEKVITSYKTKNEIILDWSKIILE